MVAVNKLKPSLPHSQSLGTTGQTELTQLSYVVNIQQKSTTNSTTSNNNNNNNLQKNNDDKGTIGGSSNLGISKLAPKALDMKAPSSVGLIKKPIPTQQQQKALSQPDSTIVTATPKDDFETTAATGADTNSISNSTTATNPNSILDSSSLGIGLVKPPLPPSDSNPGIMNLSSTSTSTIPTVPIVPMVTSATNNNNSGSGSIPAPTSTPAISSAAAKRLQNKKK